MQQLLTRVNATRLIVDMIKLLLLFLPSVALANPVDEAARDALKWDNTKLAGKMSDYGLIGMSAGVVAYQKGWEQRGAVVGAYALNAGVNYAVKRLVGRERPDGSDHESFYSGHTSTAFVGAAAVCLQDNKAVCAAGLGMAAMIGYLRIAANKHWLSDVSVGAGVGYLSGRFIPTIFVAF